MRTAGFASGVALALCGAVWAAPLKVTVDVNRPLHSLSRLLTGACIEDVNHEIYGGLYSQMLFGERFQEPPLAAAPNGFTAFEGAWAVNNGVLDGAAGDGPKLVAEMAPFADGEAGVEVFFPDARPGNAGLIMRVANAQPGSDRFDGYEISLDSAAQIVRLGRHRHDWEHFSDTPCPVPIGQWIELKIVMKGALLEVFVDGRPVAAHNDTGRVLGPGVVGLRQWKRAAKYRDLWAASGGKKTPLPFEAAASAADEISGMWRAVRRGSARGTFRLETASGLAGAPSQCIEFREGEGAWGIENRGLNRWGLHFKESAAYEGVLWARAEAPVELWAALENADGSRTYAEKRLEIPAGDWQRLSFELSSGGTEEHGRFALAYADQNARDHAALVEAIKDGRLPAESNV